MPKQIQRFFPHIFLNYASNDVPNPLQCTCVTLRCPHTGPLDNLAPPYLHVSLQEARCIVGWDPTPRTTPWETTGLRGDSTAHKVRHGCCCF